MAQDKPTPKPIFLVGTPIQGDVFEDQYHVKNLANLIKSKIGDEYHVLVYGTGLAELKFQVFYEKDFNEVKYEELKAIISNLV